MIIYSSDVRGFRKDTFNGVLIEKLDRLVTKSYQRSSQREVSSWKNSLSYMERVIAYANLPNNAGIAIEYMIPSTSKRIDFIVSGYDSEDRANVVIVELKQWEAANCVDGKYDLVETYVGGANREVAHPCYQAWSYAKLIEDFNSSVQEQAISLYPCAYLHNYLEDKIDDPLTDHRYKKILDNVPLFDQTGGPDLAEFIRKYVRKGDDKKILYHIEHGKIRPSKSLQDSIASMLQGNKDFIMIDDQKVIYENAVTMAEKSFRDLKKRVYIVEGGPGTGKSVISINLLSELLNRDMIVHYITKNSAPRSVYKTKLKGSMTINSIDNLFKGSGSYVDSKLNEIDVAIVDEAHRLTEKSNFFGKGENQIKEIINSSKMTIFFVDDRQVITTKDIGKKTEIIKWAEEMDAIIEEDTLESQFRCNGSEGYISWIDDVLQIRETANSQFDLDYDFGIVDTPQELLSWVRENNKNNKARIIAGYCWDWPKAERSNPDFFDINISEFDFGMSWNLDKGIWALDPEAVNIAGCIHTSQGLEFEYIGVIIGPDMYFRDGEVKTNFSKRAKTDGSIKGLKKLEKEDSEKAQKLGDEIIRNTYRTLLTRGMKGCRVFCTDNELAEYLKNRRYGNDIIDLYEYDSNIYISQAAESIADYEIDEE